MDLDLIKGHYGGVLSGDFFGTGKLVALLPEYSKVGSSHYVNFYFVEERQFKVTGKILKHSTELPEIAVRDIDNDGIDEIVFIEKGKSGDKYEIVILKYDANKNAFSENRIQTTLSSNPSKIFLADFNGNGLADLCVLTETNYCIYWNKGSDISQCFDSKITSNSFHGEYSTVEIGDINGDGLPDFLLNPKNSSTWYIALNGGKGIFSKKNNI